MSRVTISRAGQRFPRVAADLIGDDAVTGGVGGWEVLERPRRSAAVAWVGTPVITWVLPLMFDGVDEDTSIDAAVTRLTGWGSPAPGDDQPPALTVNAPYGRAPAQSTWVIADIEWGEQERNTDGVRVRQEFALTLLEYVPGRVLRGPAAKARDKSKKHKWVATSATNRHCKVCKKPRDNKAHNNRG